MAGRIRTLKPEILEKARTAELADDAWRLFVSMILLADDYGNLDAHPRRLQGAVWWARGVPRDPRVILAEVSGAGLVNCYEVRGQLFVSIVGWNEHQRVDKPGKPRVPFPDQGVITIPRGNDWESPGTLATDLRPPTCTNDHDHDHDHDLTNTSPPAPEPVLAVQFDFASVYDAYPRKEGKTKGLARLRSQVRTPEAFDELQKAVRHYAEKIKAEGTATRFVKHFSTWCSEWRDFVEGPHIVSSSNGNTSARSKRNHREPMPHQTETVDETDKL